MCIPISDVTMIDWLKRQVQFIEAWREEIATRAEIDIAEVERVERHYQWLTSEVNRLENYGHLRAVQAA